MLMVLKFGGSSLADSARVLGAAARIAAWVRQGNRVIVVVSAQGDTTDELLAKAKAINEQPNLREMDSYSAAGEQMSAGLMAMAIQSLGVPAVSLTGWRPA